MPTAALRVTPLKEPTPTAQVDALVNRYSLNERDTARPTVAQISAVVKACASLNAVEWAGERQRLKTVCGDGLKIADLDRLYRQARREQERSERLMLPDAERYVSLDGAMVFERQTERGVSQQKVANWTGRILERITRIDDDGQPEHLVALELVGHEETQTLILPSELFGDANALQRFIAAQAGEQFTVRARMHSHLPAALLSLSPPYPRRRTYRFMGWTRLDDQWVYVSPSLSVSAAGVLEAPPEVELETRLRDYGLSPGTWDESLAAFDATLAVLPPSLAPALAAFALLPVVQRFFPAAAPKLALHLTGTTGSGKSEIAALLSSFYGQFTRDTPPAQWGDTVNTVETLGYALADGMYWVDDYKAIYADEKTFTRFLQSYSRGMGRGRLTKETRLRHERPCRGLLLSTGETTLEGEASVLARMLVLEIPPWERRDPGGKALAQAEALRPALPGFTVHFIQWMAAQADAGTLNGLLASGYATSNAGYRARLGSSGVKQANTGRVINNWAVLNVTYRLLWQFLVERDAEEALPFWQDSLLETVKAVQQERAGQLFLDVLGQLVAGGHCAIADNLHQPEDYPVGTTIVGYREGGAVYLLPDVALREINKTHPLKFTKTAIGNQLREDGVLLPGKDSLTVQRRVRGIPARLWQIKGEVLGCDTGDAVT